MSDGQLRDRAATVALERLQASPQSIGLLADDTCAQRTLVELVVDAALGQVAEELRAVRGAVVRRSAFDDGVRAGLGTAIDSVSPRAND